jgi:hypothetical protein
VRIVADGPGLVGHLFENLTAEMIGGKRFRQYVLPVYSEFSEILKPKGKLLAAHCDGHLKSLAYDLAGSALDIIEAFCPFPDGDMTMEEACRRWPDKIWINFRRHAWSRRKGSVRACPDSGGRRPEGSLRDHGDIPGGVWRGLPAISAALRNSGHCRLNPVQSFEDDRCKHGKRR